ncbi:hypothetical protein ACA910_000440 [Epithemia clementina (nom. ined.)]
MKGNSNSNTSDPSPSEEDANGIDPNAAVASNCSAVSQCKSNVDSVRTTVDNDDSMIFCEEQVHVSLSQGQSRKRSSGCLLPDNLSLFDDKNTSQDVPMEYFGDSAFGLDGEYEEQPTVTAGVPTTEQNKPLVDTLHGKQDPDVRLISELEHKVSLLQREISTTVRKAGNCTI